MEVRVDIRSLDISHRVLTWSNTIRIKVESKTKDTKISINEISFEMVGKKVKKRGVINPAHTTSPGYSEHPIIDFPLIIQGKEVEEFYIPVTFEYSKRIGANHQIVLEIKDIFINNEAVNIQPITFSYLKTRK
jgi:hypothetical protein